MSATIMVERVPVGKIKRLREFKRYYVDHIWVHAIGLGGTSILLKVGRFIINKSY